MFRPFEKTRLFLLVLFLGMLLGCQDPPKPRYVGKYVLAPVRDILHVQSTVYEGANSIGTVRKIESDEDNFYLVVEFVDERSVKNSTDTIIEQSNDGRLSFQRK
jgi:hypothetical protein